MSEPEDISGPIRRVRLRSDGAAENPQGLRMNSWDTEVKTQGSQDEQLPAGSGESGGETRLQHGSPAGTSDPENQGGSGDEVPREEEKDMEDGRKTDSKKEAGSSLPGQDNERAKHNRGTLRNRSGSERRRVRENNTKVRHRRGRERILKDGSSKGSSGSSSDLEKSLHLERLVRLEESLMTVQKEVSSKFELISTLLLQMKSEGVTLQENESKQAGHERPNRGGSKDRAGSRSSTPTKETRKKKKRKKGTKVHFEESSEDSSEGAIPFSREKHLEAVRKVPALANKKNPLEWLLAYKQYSRSRKWSDADYCHMLPLVWDDRKGGATEEWFEGLSERRRSTPIKLEKAFVRKFGQEDTENFVQEAMYSVQGDDEFCEDWFIKVYKQFKQMREWVPRDMPTEERFMRVVVTRFTDRAMLQSLNEAQGLDEDTESSTDGAESGRMVLTVTQIRRLAKKADRLRRRLEAQGSKRHKQRELSPEYSLVEDIAVKAIDLRGEGDDELEQVYEFYAENQVSDLGGVLSVRSVAVALARLELPRARQTRREVDMKDFRNVVSSKHEADHENQICGFHACKLRGCNMGGRCAHAHEDRKNVKCQFYASPLECPHGIFCRQRHQNEEYGVWFRDRTNPGSYRFAIWKDQKSRFRREPQE